MHRLAISTVMILGLLALAGCSFGKPPPVVAIQPQLPDLPSRAVSDCSGPIAKEGDDLGVLALEWKATAKCERGKKHGIAGYYGDVQKGLAGK